MTDRQPIRRALVSVWDKAGLGDLVTALHEAGVEVVYAELAHVDHFTFTEWRVIGPLMLAFLDMHLHPTT